MSKEFKIHIVWLDCGQLNAAAKSTVEEMLTFILEEKITQYLLFFGYMFDSVYPLLGPAAEHFYEMITAAINEKSETKEEDGAGTDQPEHMETGGEESS